jgi:hypothetical protein
MQSTLGVYHPQSNDVACQTSYCLPFVEVSQPVFYGDGLNGVEDEDGLSTAGLDISKASNHAKHLNAAAQVQGLHVRAASKTVYDNPTMAKLISKIMSLKDEIESQVTDPGRSEMTA